MSQNRNSIYRKFLSSKKFNFKNLLSFLKKPLVKKILLVSISIFLLYILLKDVQLYQIIDAIKLADKKILILAFSLHAVGLIVSSLRWKILLQSLSIESSFIFLVKSYLVATFFNHFIPSTVGGDSVRTYDSYKLGKDKTHGLTVVLVDRFLGLLTLLIFVILATFISIELSSQIPNLYVWIIFFSLPAIGIIWIILQPPNKLFKKLKDHPHKIKSLVGAFLFKVGSAFLKFSKDRQVLISSLLLSFFLQFNVIIYYYLISLSLGFDIHILNFVLIVPLTIFLMMIPITVNGIGIRENVLYFFFAFFGISKSQAIAFAWIEFGMLLILGLIGGVVFMMRKREKNQSIEPT